MSDLKYKYLIRDRLGDIITLIQILALANEDYANDGSIISRFNKKPKSALTWTDISREHPEFFLFHDSKIYLNYRFYEQRKMSTEQAMNLVNNASAIHDKELSQRNKNSFLVPLYIAIFSTLFSVFSLFYNANKVENVVKKTIESERQILLDSLKKL